MTDLSGLRLCKFHDFGVDFEFAVANPGDIIQKHFIKGELYEKEELTIIKNHADGCDIFYDIGSNVGNHAIFMAKILKARRVYAFEANKRASDLLRANVELNKVENIVDLTHTEQGIGRDFANLRVFNPQPNNLGAARLKKVGEDFESQDGYFASVNVVPIDSLNLEYGPDFVKIDVEGMELAVLEGMKSTIARSRPKMFIEVNNSNSDGFKIWAEINHYEMVESFSRYDSNVNYVIVPSGS